MSRRHARTLLAAAALWAGWSGAQAQPTAGDAVPVRVVAARLGKLTAARETAVVIGPEQESTVVAPTSGTVLEVLKRQDMPVAAGETVVRLDAATLTQAVQDAQFALSSAQVNLSSASATTQSQAVQAELAVRAAETGYRAAEIDFLEAQDLYRIGAISQTELSTAETAFLSAETALGQARATLAQAESGGGVELLQLQVTQAEANLAAAQAALTGANVTSPLTGTVTALLAEQGSFVSEGTPVFEVASTERQLATFQVPLGVAETLQAGRELRLPFGGAVYTADVVGVSALDPATQLVTVSARLRPGPAPVPNGSVTALSYRYGDAGGIILPAGAVQLEPGRRFVFVVSGGRAERLEVEVIGEAEGKVAVLGVPENTRVIFPIPANLRAGTRVTAN